MPLFLHRQNPVVFFHDTALMTSATMYCVVHLLILYCSPFHSSLPFEHLGQSSLCINPVTFYSILELKWCPRCQVFLKFIQHLSLGNDVTSSDKKHYNCLVKAHFYFKILCTTYTMHIKNTHLK